MRLQAARAIVPSGPFVQAGERDRRGVDQPQNLGAVARQRAVRQRAQTPQKSRQRSRWASADWRPTRSSGESAGPQVVMVHGLRAPHRLNFAQARPAAQLRSDQPHQMVLGRKPLDVFVPFVALHDRCEAPPRKHFQQIAEHRILIAHAKLSFLNLVNQKDTAKPRRCLACKLLNRPIPRTALRFYGNPGLEAWAVAGALARDRVAQRQFVEPKKSVHPIG